MATVGKLTQQGELKLSGNIDTRLPLVTDGLVSHMPMDGTSGTFDMIGGIQSLQNTSENTNLIEAMQSDWRDPASWNSHTGFTYDEAMDAMRVVGYHNAWLNTPIIINPSLTYEISIEVMEVVQASANLYLGGYSLNAAGERTTVNYDYTLASNYNQPTGTWQHFKLTRTGTTTAGNGTHFTFDTVKGWDGGRDMTDPIIKFYHFGGLLNYNGGGELYFRNPSIRVVNPDTSNTTITDDYVSIDKGSSNMIPNFPATNSGYGIEMTDSDMYYRGNKVQKWEKNVDGTLAYRGWRLNVVAGTQYFASAYIFDPDNKFSRAILHDNVTNFSNTSEGVIDLEDGWKRIWATGTAQTTELCSHGFIIYHHTSDVSGAKYWITEPQVEIGSFPTEYMNTSRNTGYLQYGTDTISPTSGTFHFEAFITPSLFSSTSYIDMLDFRDGSSNNLIIIRKGAGADIPNQIFIRDGSIWRSTGISANIIQNAWNSFTWCWDTTTGYRMFVNNTLVKSSTAYTVSDQAYVYYQFSQGWNIKNLSIYNRALTNDEVTKLNKGTHSISVQGLISPNGISTVHNPKHTSNYFPFDIDGKDIYKNIISTKDENTTYTDGSVFIGSGTTNLIVPTSFNKTYGDYEGWEGIGVTNDVPRTYVFHQDIIVEPNTDYAISVIYRTSENQDDIYLSFNGTGYPEGDVYLRVFETTKKTNPIYKEDLGGGFSRFSSYFTTTEDTTAITSMFFDSDIPEQVIFLGNAQLEIGSINTPFAGYNTTRGQSSLHLPYDIIDCKQDFTIYGWWNPKVIGDSNYRPCLTRNPADSNDSGNRILIMNNYTSGILRTWIGSGNVTETAQTAPGLIITNEWNFFCYRRIGTDLVLTLGNSNNFGHSIDGIGEAHVLDTDEVNQVWQVGEYLNSESDAYHKDYVFYQGAMTDTEIEEVFKTKMKATSDGLLVQNITTNQTLV